jgi:hypothetical protein
MKKLISLMLLLLAILPLFSQQESKPPIPLSYSNINYDEEGRLYIEIPGRKIYENISEPFISIDMMRARPEGTEKGIALDFGNVNFEGSIYYGFIPYGDSRHPHPVYFRSSAPISGGKAFIGIADNMSGRYDMINWEENGKGTIGYRIVSYNGYFLYDGIISFEGTGPFEVAPTIIEGPFVNLLKHNEATISFTTNMEISPSIGIVKAVDSPEEEGTALEKAGSPDISLSGAAGPLATAISGDHSETAATEKRYKGAKGKLHEIKIEGLEPATDYRYIIYYGDNTQEYSFRTAPEPGSRTSFTFAYASDSRSGNGGGERDMYGANFYIMKKIMALAMYKNSAFMQFTGDLVNGYQEWKQHIELEYANWKRAVQPFGAYSPIYVGMGNHEALTKDFTSGEGIKISVDRFPFDTESSESAFARNFVMPRSDLLSEDGAVYDPSESTTDFPSYSENVYYYTYDNVAVVVLNSDYFYSPSTNFISYSSGGLHGYIMDRQLEWLDRTISSLESNSDIDHIFITVHTPFFPNGGHVQDDMWYNGNNQYRPYVAGKALGKGIIERRDQLLDILVNKSKKVVALLTGDEHNYARTEINPDMKIYPDAYFFKKIKLNRTIYQINNGAAGAPYYAQEETPWTPWVSGFTTQNALVLFHVNGDEIEMEVLNPDTLEEVDRLKLR